MGRSTLMALLLCLSLLLSVTTEARTRVAFSSSSNIIDSHYYFPPPREEGPGGGWKTTLRAARHSPLAPTPPAAGTNHPYNAPVPPLIEP